MPKWDCVYSATKRTMYGLRRRLRWQRRWRRRLPYLLVISHINESFATSALAFSHKHARTGRGCIYNYIIFAIIDRPHRAHFLRHDMARHSVANNMQQSWNTLHLRCFKYVQRLDCIWITFQEYVRIIITHGETVFDQFLCLFNVAVHWMQVALH